ncbi:MAG: DegV family protein [Eggerthellaceae bacterium]|jgi:DegV family protein with EDD domain|nr:DegV family protein [Eggerthellaceae bacterium]MCH4221090.1 DegV family protein [Eggerthellaceae bacterium]
MMQKIALITDSCTDVPADFAREHHIYTAPLTITFDSTSYRDKIDISPTEVYKRMKDDLPHTSLPSPTSVQELFDQAIADGCTHILVVTISSGLSGTFDLMRSVGTSYAAKCPCAFVDTLSIGLGAGLTVMRAAELIAEGLDFKEVVQKTLWTVQHSHVFFCVDALDYLYKGGRINRAVYSLGSVLNVRPIITCNASGAYVPVAKARGRKASLKKTMDAARKTIAADVPCRLAIVNGDAEAEAEALIDRAKNEVFPNARSIIGGQISPALVVHTGPGLIGIGVQELDD